MAVEADVDRLGASQASMSMKVCLGGRDGRLPCRERPCRRAVSPHLAIGRAHDSYRPGASDRADPDRWAPGAGPRTRVGRRGGRRQRARARRLYCLEPRALDELCPAAARDRVRIASGSLAGEASGGQRGMPTSVACVVSAHLPESPRSRWQKLCTLHGVDHSSRSRAEYSRYALKLAPPAVSKRRKPWPGRGRTPPKGACDHRGRPWISRRRSVLRSGPRPLPDPGAYRERASTPSCSRSRP